MFVDSIGPVGSTTSDSERAMVRLETTRILMVIISFWAATDWMGRFNGPLGCWNDMLGQGKSRREL